jgi:cysteinyl-tRNA synthetase
MKRLFPGIMILSGLVCGYAQTAMDLSDIHSFLYQLQELDLHAAAQTGFDLVVMDYSSDGSDEAAYSSEQIALLKSGPGGKKTVLSYLSIGEAEDYRFYWQDAWRPGHPVWLDEENAEWEGNYKVRYWNPEWKSIIFSYLDRILNAGFDGVYLDLVDAYETYDYLSSIQASQEMVSFIGEIRDRALIADEDFIIFAQNASELARIHPLYLGSIDGIGQEDLYYGYNGDGMPTPAEVSAELEENLDVYLSAGKTVLTIDYPFADGVHEPHFDGITLNKIRDAYTKSRDRGFVPYCTVCELDYMTINPGFEPSCLLQEYRPDFMPIVNVPNPFNHSTTLFFQLKFASDIELHVTDVLGRQAGVINCGIRAAGEHRIIWDASQLPSGFYFFTVQAGRYRAVSRAELLK